MHSWLRSLELASSHSSPRRRMPNGEDTATTREAATAGPGVMEARGGTLAIAGMMGTAAMEATTGPEATTTSPTGTPPKLLMASKTGSETDLTTSSRMRTHGRPGPTKVTVTPTQDQPPATTVRGRTIAHNGSSQSASAVKNGLSQELKFWREWHTLAGDRGFTQPCRLQAQAPR